jgi:hypothetical protein
MVNSPAPVGGRGRREEGGAVGGFGVFEDFAFVVADDDAVVIAAEDVFGADGDFAAAAGCIDDVLGDGVAGGMAAEFIHDLEALSDAGAEVGGAGDQIALIDVVGSHAAHEEFLDEGLHDVRIVVDVAEEDGLVAEGDAGIGEAAQGVADLGGEFAGVIGVDAEEERVKRLSIAQNSGVIRCGKKIGMRVPIRMNSTWGIARSWRRRCSSLASLRRSGSPPLRRTSRIWGVRRM